MICTLLDPRFKLLNFNGSTNAIKKDAEKYLKANYNSDWSPKARAATVYVTPTPADKGARSSIPVPTLSSPSKNVNTKKVHTNYILDLKVKL